MEDEKAKFLKIFGNIPENLRRDIIAVIDEKPYTWNVAYIEIKNNTELGNEILKSLKELEII
ncbi:MAG: hypothetical protein ABH840_00170 [Nanoarchaeota archaeon]